MVFLKASINDSIIYLKVYDTLVERTFDIFHDAGYIVTKSTVDEWDYNIEYGISFEMLDEGELEEFIESNLKVKEIRNGLHKDT